MTKVVAFDIGTNSLGTVIRNPEKGKSLQDQIEYFSSDIFDSGVGTNQSGEYSYAAQRTQHRSSRTLFNVRRRRNWATLKLLIEQNCCPLSMEDLKKWSTYDKTKGLFREYPIDNQTFQQWIKLDFDQDGKPDYSSPYQLRKELATIQLDFSQSLNRYKLGRALYHISQRRGFKSSKGETLLEQKEISADLDLGEELKKSELKKSSDITNYITEHNLHTVGEAFASLENEGIRIRGSQYQAVRSQYKDEIFYIFTFQEGLCTESKFYKSLVSDKKGEGTIFYKNPLKSQKGLIGKCTLEPKKSRCPESHPAYEEFRAWCFINNIRYKRNFQDTWSELALSIKQALYNQIFTGKLREYFQFKEIRVYLEKELDLKFIYTDKQKTINYKDNQSISGCPVCARLRRMLGDDWKTVEIKGYKSRYSHSQHPVKHVTTYNAIDLWNICFNASEAEDVVNVATHNLAWNSQQAKQLVSLWSSIKQGYAMLSLKAIYNINYFLSQGLIYTDAVLLAKLPDIFGKEEWNSNLNNIQSITQVYLNEIKENLRYETKVKSIANDLIAQYKAIGIDFQFAFHNYDYVLQADDLEDVNKCIQRNIGSSTWKTYPEDLQARITNDVISLYQDFFYSKQRDYYRISRVSDMLKNYLAEKYSGGDLSFIEKLDQLYHPSEISIYPAAKCVEGGDYVALPTPIIGSIKNPVVMRTLQILRSKVNSLLQQHLIDPEDTRVVIETARDFNDSNMRWALREYQKVQENTNKEIAKILLPYFDETSTPADSDILKAKFFMEQIADTEDAESSKKDEKLENSFQKYCNKLISSYKLWKEQNHICMYTGKVISFASLLNGNEFDLEHTIPRSMSFDSSQANLTVCDSHYNRAIKRKRFPTQLENYEHDAVIDGVTYTAILPRLKGWKNKVTKLEDNVKFWQSKSRRSTTKDQKDSCIRQKHLWEMELDYWRNKVSRFTCEEVTTGFKHRQLNDTRIATKYAVLYLKSAFPKVEVQKGQVTAIFRKILGIQQVDEKKNRDNHYHHAIDAAVLSLIPTAAVREKLIENFYRREESTDLERKHYEEEIQDILHSSGLSTHCDALCKYIRDNIFVIHKKRNLTNRPVLKKIRKRGKIAHFEDSHGNIVCRYSQGDSIRGAIHQASYYGAIKPAKDKEIAYVIRRDLKYKQNDQDTGFKNWEDLEKAIVNKYLVAMMKSQFSADTSFKDACAEGIFMLDKEGNKINKIRHIRCYTSVKNPLKIKKHTYLSHTDYKQYVYAQMGDLYAMCKYTNSGNTEYTIYSLYDIVENRKNGLEDIPNQISSRKHKNLNLDLELIIKTGDMFLLYQNSPEELYDLDNSELSKRLYVVLGFENPSKIRMVQHFNAQKDSDLGKGENVKDFNELPSKIRCSINTLHFLVYGKDFTIVNGKINFRR